MALKDQDLVVFSDNTKCQSSDLAGLHRTLLSFMVNEGSGERQRAVGAPGRSQRIMRFSKMVRVSKLANVVTRAQSAANGASESNSVARMVVMTAVGIALSK